MSINAMTAYYSSNIFLASGFSQVSALASSLGFGALNWLFAIPAVFTVSGPFRSRGFRKY
jgi:hypothetical protein